MSYEQSAMSLNYWYSMAYSKFKRCLFTIRNTPRKGSKPLRGVLQEIKIIQ